MSILFIGARTKKSLRSCVIFSFTVPLPANTKKYSFPLKIFVSECDQARRKLTICSHLREKSLMENFFFAQCASKIGPLKILETSNENVAGLSENLNISALCHLVIGNIKTQKVAI